MFGKENFIPFHHKISHPQLTKMSFLIIQGTAHNKIVTQNDVETSNMLFTVFESEKKTLEDKKELTLIIRKVNICLG